jgi:lysophospholipase L1-like esterase
MLRKIYLILVLLLFGYLLVAQPRVMLIDTLEFARFDKNCFQIPADTSRLNAFFDKFNVLVQTGKGNINILHIGGSHVQAGTFPHRIRKNILQTYPKLTARRGMIFPYAVAPKCNNPIDYRVSSKQRFSLIRNVYKELEKPLGVTGIAVYTQDTLAEINFSLKDTSLRFETEKIYLLGFSDKNTVIPVVRIDTVEYLPVKIDTVLRRFTYEVKPFTDTFAIKIVNDSVDTFTITGIFLDNTKNGITYHSIGVNGASVSSFLKCDYFVTDLHLLQPDLVIFALGINDAAGDHFDTLEFVNNYLLLINKVKEINPDCAFIFITNNDSFKKVSRGKYVVNNRGPVVQQQFYKLAAMTGGAVWDQFEIMGGLKSMDKWRAANLAKTDRVHFTNQGYNLLGDLFFNAFIDTLTKRQTP